ncbi:MAG: TonB family protein [Bacteroidales bacterium]|nr:TonB family protein [Bacteroidales bacterium]
MRRNLYYVCLLFLLILLSSCFSYRYSASFSQPNVITKNEVHGESSSPVFMYYFGGHSGSIKEAAENGNIDTIYRVEYEKQVILGGVFQVWTTHVYGSRKEDLPKLQKKTSPNNKKRKTSTTTNTPEVKPITPPNDSVSLPTDISADEVRIYNNPKDDSFYVLTKHSVRVYVDGKFVGLNNMKYKAIKKGSHKIELRERGYCIIEENISVVNTNSNVIKNSFKPLSTEATFPSKYGTLHGYIANNVRYPHYAEINNIMGRVEVSFIVSETGSIKQVEVTRSADKSLNLEAIMVIKSMPKWEPATMNGQKVSSYVTVPVIFGEDK